MRPGNKTNNNSSVDDKIRLRRIAVDWVGGPSKARVLDAFAGSGLMRQMAYHDCAAYQGIEQDRKHARSDVWIGDNVHLIPQAFMSGERWNLIDLDAHSNPFLALYQVGRYAPEGDYAIPFTEGFMRSMITTKPAKFVRWATGFNGEDGRCLIRWYDDFVRWAVAETPRIKVHEAKRVWRDRTHKSVVYYVMRVSFAGPAVGALLGSAG